MPGAIKGGDFLATPDEEWLRGWSLKLLGYIRMAREVLPHMQRQGGGRIVNVVGRGRAQPGDDLHDGRRRQRRADQLHQGAGRSGREVQGPRHRGLAGPVKTERWD